MGVEERPRGKKSKKKSKRGTTLELSLSSLCSLSLGIRRIISIAFCFSSPFDRVSPLVLTRAELH